MFETLEITGTYTRADALRDGVLSDVTAEFARHRFWCPVAVTASISALIKEDLDIDAIAYQLYQRIQSGVQGDTVYFRVQGHELKSLAHGDDSGDLCLTIMLPSED